MPRALTEQPHPVQPWHPQTPHPIFELPPFGMQVERGLLGAEAAKVGSGVGWRGWALGRGRRETADLF